MKLIDDIMAARAKHYERDNRLRREFNERRTTPRNPIASDVNAECPREMYHGIVDWKDRADPPLHRAARMDAGKMDELRVKSMLLAWGFEVALDQAPVVVRDRKGRKAYTGKIDGVICTNGGGAAAGIPYETKAYHPSLHGRIDTVEDFALSEWTRRAPRQLLMYLLAEGKTDGLFILYCLGDVKLIPIVLEDHMADAERFLSLAEGVLDAVEKGKPPAYAKDPITCRHCWAFGTACNPPLEEQGAVIWNDPETVQLLDVCHQTKAARDAYNSAWDEVKLKARATKKDRLIIGRYAVTVTDRNVKGREQPAKTIPPRVDRIVKMARAAEKGETA